MAIKEAKRKTGFSVFKLDFYDELGKRHRWTGKPFRTVDKTARKLRMIEAQKHELEVSEQVAKGTYRRAEVYAPTTFGEVLGDYLKESEGQRGHGSREQIGKVLRAAFGERPITAITDEEVDRFILERAEATSNSTAMKTRNTLAAFFKWARKRRYVQVSPAEDAVRLRIEKKPMRYFSHDEWAATYESLPPWLKPWGLFGLGTGARLRTVAEFKWSGIDKQGGRLHLMNFKRGGTPYHVKASETALEAVGMCRRGTSPYVFKDDEGRPVLDEAGRTRLSKMFSAYCPDGLSFHALRHSYATWAAQSGESMAEIATALNHSNIQVTYAYYYHHSPESGAGVASAVDRALGRDLVAQRKQSEAGIAK